MPVRRARVGVSIGEATPRLAQGRQRLAAGRLLVLGRTEGDSRWVPPVNCAMAMPPPPAAPRYRRVGLRMPPAARATLTGLFPPGPGPRVSLPAALLVVAVLGLGTVAGIARQTGVGAVDTIYAEDGQIFLGQALRAGPVETLTEPYMGYFHTLPRIVSGIATAVPLRDAAAFISIAAALILTALALVVFRASSGHIGSTYIRALLAASVVLLPVAQDEVFNNVANLHWFFMFASAWVLLWNPRTRWELGLGVMVLLLSGMSDPLTAVLAPLALLRLLALRGWRSHVFTAAFAVGMVLQVGAIVIGRAERQGLVPTGNVPKLAFWYLFYVFARAVFGMRLVRDTASLLARALAGVSLLVAAVVTALAFIHRARGAMVALALMALSVVFYVAPVAATGVSAPRYAVVPVLLLVSAVACLVDGVDMAERLTRTVLIGAVVVLLLAGWAGNYRFPNARAAGPRWSQAVSTARSTCEQAGAVTVTVPITPPGWHVEVPCRGALHTPTTVPM